MFTTLTYAFLVVSGAYMTVHYWRRRYTNDKARIVAGVEAVITAVWAFLFLAHLN